MEISDNASSTYMSRLGVSRVDQPKAKINKFKQMIAMSQKSRPGRSFFVEVSTDFVIFC